MNTKSSMKTRMTLALAGAVMAMTLGGCGKSDAEVAAEARAERIKAETERRAELKAINEAQYQADLARIRNMKMPPVLIGDAYSKGGKDAASSKAPKEQ
jgi:N-acetylmuramoyl-L-alanine amidase